MHSALLVPALGALAATWRLAKIYEAPPVLVTVLLAFSPAFLVSSTTVMADVFMLNFWIWTLVAWETGLSSHRSAPLATAVLLAIGAAMTKYVGMALFPLMMVIGIVRTRRVGGWIVWILAGVAVIVAYDFAMHSKYGVHHVGQAMGYATGRQTVTRSHPLFGLATGLAFLGAANLVSAFHICTRFRLRGWVTTVAAVAVAATALAVTRGQWVGRLQEPEAAGWAITLQWALLVVAGGVIVSAAAAIHRQGRPNDAVVLLCWIAGIFAFATLINWSVNVRSILPASPAVAIVAAIAFRESTVAAKAKWASAVAIATGAGVAILLAWADMSLADAGKSAVVQLAPRLRSAPVVWFDGHWGFQYYAEAAGWRPYDSLRSRMAPGDPLVVPVNNSTSPKIPSVVLRHVQELRVFPLVTTMDMRYGAGFISDLWGPIPFFVGSIAPEQYLVFQRAGSSH